MIKLGTTTVRYRGTLDWCNFCGKRHDSLVGVDFLENAEHGTGNHKYIRICSVCVKTLAEFINAREAQEVSDGS